MHATGVFSAAKENQHIHLLADELTRLLSMPGEAAGIQTMIAEIRQTRLAFVGETHFYEPHAKNIYAVCRALAHQPYACVGLESRLDFSTYPHDDQFMLWKPYAEKTNAVAAEQIAKKIEDLPASGVLIAITGDYHLVSDTGLPALLRAASIASVTVLQQKPLESLPGPSLRRTPQGVYVAEGTLL